MLDCYKIVENTEKKIWETERANAQKYELVMLKLRKGRRVNEGIWVDTGKHGCQKKNENFKETVRNQCNVELVMDGFKISVCNGGKKGR